MVGFNRVVFDRERNFSLSSARKLEREGERETLSRVRIVTKSVIGEHPGDNDESGESRAPAIWDNSEGKGYLPLVTRELAEFGITSRRGAAVCAGHFRCSCNHCPPVRALFYSRPSEASREEVFFKARGKLGRALPSLALCNLRNSPPPDLRPDRGLHQGSLSLSRGGGRVCTVALPRIPRSHVPKC